MGYIMFVYMYFMEIISRTDCLQSKLELQTSLLGKQSFDDRTEYHLVYYMNLTINMHSHFRVLQSLK